MKNTDNWRNDFSTEYYLVKRATSKENIRNSMKIVGYAALFIFTSWVAMYLFMYLILAIWYA